VITTPRQGHRGQQRPQRPRTQRRPFSAIRRAIVSAAFVVLCVLVGREAFPQGRFVNARAETLSASAGLESAVRTTASRTGVTWIGYRAPMVGALSRLMSPPIDRASGQLTPLNTVSWSR